MNKLLLASIISLLLLNHAVYENEDISVSIDKPGNWYSLSLSDIIDNIKNIKHRDPSYVNNFKRNSKPIFAISKFKEPCNDLNTVVVVFIYDNKDSRFKLESLMDSLVNYGIQYFLNDYSINIKSQKKKIKEYDSIYSEFDNSFLYNKNVYKVTHGLWLLEFNKYIIQIEAQWPRNDNNSTTQINSTLETIIIK